MNKTKEIHNALTAANLEYCAFSCNGVNLFGDMDSIKTAARAFHSHAQIDEFRTQIRHWREECGKLHAKPPGYETMIDQAEARVKCRLAWNNWPDNDVSRREIADHEARDPTSAIAWDRVIDALVNFTKSAPALDTSHNNGEMLPNGDAAGAGAGTDRNRR